MFLCRSWYLLHWVANLTLSICRNFSFILISFVLTVICCIISTFCWTISSVKESPWTWAAHVLLHLAVIYHVSYCHKYQESSYVINFGFEYFKTMYLEIEIQIKIYCFHPSREANRKIQARCLSPWPICSSNCKELTVHFTICMLNVSQFVFKTF